MGNCPGCGYTMPQVVIMRVCPKCGIELESQDIRADLDEHGQPRCREYNAARLSERSLDELIGMAKMAISDGIVTLEEAEFIMRWMKQNADVASCWPGNRLFARLSAMLSDRKLDRDEQRELLDLLLDMTGTDLETFDAKNNSTALPFDQPQPQVKFGGSMFCFTGKFIFGTRRCCQEAVLTLNGVPLDTITKGLNYLIIGRVGSTNWIHSTHGRKIEKAVDYRESGNPLAIISEEHWVSCLQAQL